jgi:glutathione S-transferase
MKLIIATPSPFARKARIALLEKNLPHEVRVQNPWQSAIAENPLGKVPALVLDDGRVVHDSSVIVEYLETLGAPPALIPSDPAGRVTHRQIEALADGICDAVVLIVLERAREVQSADWLARQRRKIELALDELERALGEDEWFTESGYGLADIASGCALGYVELRCPEFDWRAAHPRLAALASRLALRPAFAATLPSAQPIPRQI